MCIGNGISAMLQTPEDNPSSAQLIKFGSAINVLKGRKASNNITKAEFTSYCSEYIASCGVTSPTINNLILLLNGSILPIVKKVVVEDD